MSMYSENKREEIGIKVIKMKLGHSGKMISPPYKAEGINTITYSFT